MSIRVDRSDVPALLAGRWGYLVVAGSTPPDAPRALAVRPRVEDRVVLVDVGTGSVAALIAGGAGVSLVIVPDGQGDLGAYSLIVDGSAVVHDGAAEFTPTGAVWHRPAP
jgi:hypothetical protein